MVFINLHLDQENSLYFYSKLIHSDSDLCTRFFSAHIILMLEGGGNMRGGGCYEGD